MPAVELVTTITGLVSLLRDQGGSGGVDALLINPGFISGYGVPAHTATLSVPHAFVDTTQSANRDTTNGSDDVWHLQNWQVDIVDSSGGAPNGTTVAIGDPEPENPWRGEHLRWIANLQAVYPAGTLHPIANLVGANSPAYGAVHMRDGLLRGAAPVSDGGGYVWLFQPQLGPRPYQRALTDRVAYLLQTAASAAAPQFTLHFQPVPGAAAQPKKIVIVPDKPGTTRIGITIAHAGPPPLPPGTNKVDHFLAYYGLFSNPPANAANAPVPVVANTFGPGSPQYCLTDPYCVLARYGV